MYIDYIFYKKLLVLFVKKIPCIFWFYAKKCVILPIITSHALQIQKNVTLIH